MTDMERQMFRAEIRDYLLENPEVIMEAVRILEERQTEAAGQGRLRTDRRERRGDLR